MKQFLLNTKEDDIKNVCKVVAIVIHSKNIHK